VKNISQGRAVTWDVSGSFYYKFTAALDSESTGILKTGQHFYAKLQARV